MDEVLRALLEVVRAQHSVTEGTGEEAFNMDDVVNMALNVLGRPEEEEEAGKMSDEIEAMVREIAPDIFPPKTFEQLDGSEQSASIASMIEESLLREGRGRTGETAAVAGNSSSAMEEASPYSSEYDAYTRDSQEDGQVFDSQQAASLNDMIYQNMMRQMGLQNPQVEYPFDRSQIRYGQEKTFTEQLAEDAAENAAADENTAGARRRLSAWELAQNAVNDSDRSDEQLSSAEIAANIINQDMAAHQRESFRMPEPEERTVSASALAAEAIRKQQEADRKQQEIERQAEILMARAKEEGQDPVAYMRAQQEIIDYLDVMSQGSATWEDYEALTPEERAEISKLIAYEKGEAVSEEPTETVPNEMTEAEDSSANDTDIIQNGSADVMQEAQEMEASTANVSVGGGMSSADLARAAQQTREAEQRGEAVRGGISAADLARAAQQNRRDVQQREEASHGISAAELARAAQENARAARAQNPEGNPEGEAGSSAQITSDRFRSQDNGGFSLEGMDEEMLRTISQQVIAQNTDLLSPEDGNPEDLGDAILENLKQMLTGMGQEVPPEDVGELIQEVMERHAGTDTASGTDKSEEDAPQTEFATESIAEPAASEKNVLQEELEELDHIFSEDDPFAEMEESDVKPENASVEREAEGSGAEEQSGAEGSWTVEPALSEETDDKESASEYTESAGVNPSVEEDMDEEYEYVDPDEMVLGEHTQAEIDEALKNLETLGLEGDVFERAKHMLLLEMAGSETALDEWLKEQEGSKKKKAAISALQEDENTLEIDDLDDFGDLEQEMEDALDRDFDRKEKKEESDTDSETEEEATEDAEILAEETESERTAEEKAEEAELATEAKAEESEPATEAKAEESKPATEAKAEESEPVPEERQEEFSTGEEAEAVSDSQTEETEEVPSEEPAVEVETASDDLSRSHRGRRRDRPARTGFKSRKNVIHRRERTEKTKDSATKEPGNVSEKIPVPEGGKTYQVSVRNQFVLRNSASFMDGFEKFISETQENQTVSTGFRKLDAMLRYGLHKGSYFIDSQPQYLKNLFVQQLADRAAQNGTDVLFISTELSRYDLMVDSIARLSYEMRGENPDQAVSSMAIMSGEPGAELTALNKELAWYRSRISEHLFILDQEVIEEYADESEAASAGDVITEMIESIVQKGIRKPLVVIDNLENLVSVEDSEDMRILMDEIRKLARQLGIAIVLSYGYTPQGSEEDLYPEDADFRESLGYMCDVYLELSYADMITEDSEAVTEEDILEMAEEGDRLLVDVMLHRNRRNMRASCQIQTTPKYNFFTE